MASISLINSINALLIQESNFHKDQNGMSTQFYQLEKLLETVDPELHAYFSTHNMQHSYLALFSYSHLLRRAELLESIFLLPLAAGQL